MNAVYGRLEKLYSGSDYVWQGLSSQLTLGNILGTPAATVQLRLCGAETPGSDYRQARSIADHIFGRMSSAERAAVRELGIDEAGAAVGALITARMDQLGVKGKNALLANMTKFADAAAIAENAALVIAAANAEKQAEAEAAAAAKAKADADAAAKALADAEADAVTADIAATAETIAAETPPKAAAEPIHPLAHLADLLPILSDADLTAIHALVNAEQMRRAELVRLADETKAADLIGASKAPRKVRTLKEIRAAA